MYTTDALTVHYKIKLPFIIPLTAPLITTPEFPLFNIEIIHALLRYGSPLRKESP